MSKMGQWFFELEEKHLNKECDNKCYFCEHEGYEL
jgi:hypothetical protein